MDFFKNVAGSVSKAVNYVVDKNRSAALVNRLKIVIRNEKEVEARAYIELGKYYYENLRDPENDHTERLCHTVEHADRRLKRAFTKLDELLAPVDGACEEDPSGCDDMCDDACEYEDTRDDDACGCGDTCECKNKTETDEADSVEAPEEPGFREQDDVSKIAYEDDDDEFLRSFIAKENSSYDSSEEAADDLPPEEDPLKP